MPTRITILLAALVVLASFGRANGQFIPPPEVSANIPDTSFALGGPAAAVDPAVTVSSFDFDITGAAEAITNFQAGDVLNFTPEFGIFDTYSSGLLTLVGSASPAQYQAALQSVTFSTTGGVGTREVTIVASDSRATPSNSNTAVVAVAVTPEPASVVMMALGAISLLGFGLRRALRASR